MASFDVPKRLHAAQHGADGPDPITPADIGAATAEKASQLDARIAELESVDGVDIKVGGSAPASGWWLNSGAPEYDPIAPSVPTGLAATASGANTVALSWTAATDNIGVAGYEYRIGSGAAAPAGASTSTTVSGLTASTPYTFQVRSFDAAGNRSGWSTSASATTLAGPDVTPPTPGTLAASAHTTSGFTLTVTGASDSGAGLHATPYRFSSDNGATWSAWQSSPSLAVTGKSPSTSYQCKHQVRDAAPTPNQATGATLAVMTAAPAPIASDDFNRADSPAGGLGTTSVGGKAWAEPSKLWSIKSNRAAPVSLVSGFALIDAGTPNVRVEADITLTAESRGLNERMCLVLRRQVATSDESPHLRLIVRANYMLLQPAEPEQYLLDDSTEMLYTYPTPFAVNETRRFGCVVKEVGGSSQMQLLYEGAVVMSRTTSRSTRPTTGNLVGLYNGWDHFHADNYTVWGA